MAQEEVFKKKNSMTEKKQTQAHFALLSATLGSFKPFLRDLTKKLVQKFSFSSST